MRLFKGKPEIVALRAWAAGSASTALVLLWMVLYFGLAEPGDDQEGLADMDECRLGSALRHLEFHRHTEREANVTAFHFHNLRWVNITKEPRSFGGWKVTADCPLSRWNHSMVLIPETRTAAGVRLVGG